MNAKGSTEFCSVAYPESRGPPRQRQGTSGTEAARSRPLPRNSRGSSRDRVRGPGEHHRERSSRHPANIRGAWIIPRDKVIARLSLAMHRKFPDHLYVRVAAVRLKAFKASWGSLTRAVQFCGRGSNTTRSFLLTRPSRARASSSRRSRSIARPDSNAIR
jgi:hypothetical protein